MNEPSGALVELDVFFPDRDRRDALRSVVLHCLENSGKFTGELLVSIGPRIGKRRFTSIYGDAVSEIRIAADELEARFADPDIDIVKVGLWSAIGLTEDVPEIVTYCGVSQDARAHDNPAIAIVGEARDIDVDGRERESNIAGMKCYKRFIEICDALDPAYGSILIEDSLPCKFDLAQGAGKRCFRNFFVSEAAYGKALTARVERLFRDAYTQKCQNGIYISTWPAFNPPHFQIDVELSLSRSAQVAKWLGEFSLQ